MANQFVVQLKNEPGAMANLAEALASRGVDLRAIGGGGLGDSGHVIMTTADDDTTRRVLEIRSCASGLRRSVASCASRAFIVATFSG